MPYYWQRLKDLYTNHPDDNWQSSSGAILGDLAWHFIDEDDTPEHLQMAVYDADEGDGEWRLPHPDEDCSFKQWIDEILANEVSQGWRDNLMETIFSGGTDSRGLSSVEVSTILHLAPCDVIQEFIQKTQQSIDDFNRSEGSYASDNTEETIIVEDIVEQRDERQSPIPDSYYGWDEVNWDLHSDGEDFSSMPELESCSDDDTEDEDEGEDKAPAKEEADSVVEDAEDDTEDAAKEAGHVTREGMVALLVEFAGMNPSMEQLSNKADELGIKPADAGDLLSIVEMVVDSRLDFVKERGMGALGPLMGLVMKECGGAADGKQVSALLREVIMRHSE